MKYLLAAIFTSLLVLATACSQAPPPTKSASDGIQMRGHWTVTVTNPDGTVDTAHEFENELVPSTGLTGLLIGQNKVDGWTINLVAASPYTTTNFTCKEAIGKYGFIHKILEATVTVTNKPYLPFSLNAACTVTETGDDQMGKISHVWSYFYDYDGCTLRYDSDQPESGPIECFTPSGFIKNPSYAGDVVFVSGVTGQSAFTAHSLNPDIQVSEDQVVGAKVDISFSPAP